MSLSAIDSKTIRAVFLAYFSLLLLGLSDNIRGPLYPEILKEFAVNNTTGSLFFSLSSLFGFFASLLSNRMIFRWGSVVCLRIAVSLLLTSQVIFSLAPSFWVLLLGAFLFGSSIGILGVIQNTLVVRDVPPGPLKSKLVSGLHSVYAAASLLAPITVNFVSYLQISSSLWRACFLITAALALVVLLATFGGPEIQDQGVEDQPMSRSNGNSWAQIYFGFILASYVLAEILVSSRMALFMRSELSASLSESAWYTAGFFVCLFLARLLFTLWAPKVRVKMQLVGSLALTSCSLLFGIFVHPLGLALAGFFMGPFYALMMLAAGQLFSKSISQAISWGVALSSLFIVIMHFTVGFLTDLFGLQIALLMGPFFCLLALGLLLGYEKVFRQLQHSF